MTQVFNSYGDFLKRKDKKINGVSKDFAEANPTYKNDNQTNIGCWNCKYCSNCSYCKDCRDCNFCENCSRCRYCSYCSNCSDCNNCSRCTNCNDCNYCFDSNYCSNCRNCYDCIECSDCSFCSDCISCSRCRECKDCRYCKDCHHCRNFLTNPQRIVSPKLGSRNDQTTYYFTKDREQVVCGCFTGTLEHFKAAVKEKYKDVGHGQNYFAWIKTVEVYVQSIKNLNKLK